MPPSGYGIYAIDFQTIYLTIYNNIVIINIDYDTTKQQQTKFILVKNTAKTQAT